MRLLSVMALCTWVVARSGVFADVPEHAQVGSVGAFNVRLEADGRIFSLTAPGVTGFRAGFSATITTGNVSRVLSSDSGTRVGTNSFAEEKTPCGPATVTTSTIRFEKEQIDVLFRLVRMADVPVVSLQAGIRNFGSQPVSLAGLSPLAMDEAVSTNETSRVPRCFHVSGRIKEWLVTGICLNRGREPAAKAPALKTLTVPLKIHEYGGVYRGDGAGFLFGPVGKPVAYVSARVVALEAGAAGLTLTANMSGVRVAPGEIRWGQEVALFMEPPRDALARWAEWVARTHGARTSKGALSGWTSWGSAGANVTGKDVLDVVRTVEKSQGCLRPAVIQIDRASKVARADLADIMKGNFPEGLPFYARQIGGVGARPGLWLSFDLSPETLSGHVSEIRQAVKDGYTYLKIVTWLGGYDPTCGKTEFEVFRERCLELRKAAGENAYLLFAGSVPDRAVVGVADACRVGHNTSREGLRAAMEEVLWSYHLNGRWFAVDNDQYFMATNLRGVSPVVGGWPLVRTWISMVGLSCGTAMTSDPWGQHPYMPCWRNVEILTPPAKERTEVLDLGVGWEWTHLAGHVHRAWGDWTVALLWNRLQLERTMTLDFAHAGMDPTRSYAVWSFWDNRYLGLAKGAWTTPLLGAGASQLLCFTELPESSFTPCLIGSSLHIYCGAAEINRVSLQQSVMRIELTDAGARSGDLFIYSRTGPVLKGLAGCEFEGIKSAGENVWKIVLKNRRHDVAQWIELGIPLPVTRQAWFWGVIALLVASLLFGAWKYVAGIRIMHQRALEQERTRISKDLHDDLGSSLTQIAYLGDGLMSHEGLSPELAAEIDKMRGTARELTHTLDETVWAVDPEKDTLDSLVGYLVGLAQELLSNAGVNCRFDVPDTLPPRPVSANLRHHVFLAFKEVLHNIIRHAGASEVTFRFGIRSQDCTLVIEDNGCGFDPDGGGGRPGGGRGLNSIRSRLAAIGGRCEVSSRPGAGTEVRFIWRLRS